MNMPAIPQIQPPARPVDPQLRDALAEIDAAGLRCERTFVALTLSACLNVLLLVSLIYLLIVGVSK